MSTTILSSLSKHSKEQFVKDLKDFYIPYRNNLDLPSDATFGFEIEFNMNGFDEDYKSNFIDENNAAQYFFEGLGYDYPYDVESEENNHIELISPVLVDKEETWQELDNVLCFIKNNDGNTNRFLEGDISPSCGAHVHVGRNIFNDNPSGWFNFFKLWSIFEDYIFRFTNGEFYNLRIRSIWRADEIKDICHWLLDDFNKHISCLIDNKKNCINFCSSNNYNINLLQKVDNPNENDKSKTIEFRGPNGTLNKVIWQNNTNLFIKLLLACANPNFDVEKLNHLYNNPNDVNELVLCDFIFQDDFDKMCFLRQYYKDFNEPKEEDPSIKSKRFWK